MPRDLGGVPLVEIQKPEILWYFFVKNNVSGTIRYTDRPDGFVGDIDGTSQTWDQYDFRVGPLEQGAYTMVSVSWIDIANLDNVWSSLVLNNGARNKDVTVYVGWFNVSAPNTLLGKYILFDGKMDHATLNGFRVQISIVPHRPSWSTSTLRRIRPSCSDTFKDPDTCGYAAIATLPAPVLAQLGGGTLADGTYSYRTTAVAGENNGETLASVAATIVVSGGGGAAAVRVTITKRDGDREYKVYGRVGGSEGFLSAVTAAPWQFTDTGSITPGAVVPVSNTTGLDTTCDKTRTKCKLKGNEHRFAGFDMMPRVDKPFVWGANTALSLPVYGVPTPIWYEGIGFFP